MPRMTLPFNKMDKLPSSAFAPQMPTQLNGVEMQAAAKRAPLPTINTAASDQVAKLGMMSPPANAPTPAPQVVSGPGMMPEAPAPAASPFGGMPTAPLSDRSGPMGYSPKGVGTNNPNSYAVGKNNRNFPARTGQMTVSAPGMMPPQAAPMPMLGGPNPTRVAGPGMQPQTQAPINPMGRDDAFWAGLKQQSADYQAQVQAEKSAGAKKAEEEFIYQRKRTDMISDEQRHGEQARETYALKDPLTGQPHTGHFMTGNGMTLPSQAAVQTPQPGLMEIPGTNLRMPTLGGERIVGAPMLKENVNAPGDGMGPVQRTLEPAQVDQPKFTADKETGRLYYVQPDGKGGFVRRWVADANGDGIPDVQPGQTAPVQTQGQTKSGIKFSVK